MKEIHKSIGSKMLGLAFCRLQLELQLLVAKPAV
jgi:cytochrome b561